jgi:putative transposase
VNDRHLTIAALKRAVLQRCPGVDLLHHSDQGSTYASEDYQEVLAEHGITCSMSRRGEVLDNAAMEAWNSTFKFECGERFETNEIAETKAFDYIEVFYNRQRRPRPSATLARPSSRDGSRRGRQRSQTVHRTGSSPEGESRRQASA